VWLVVDDPVDDLGQEAGFGLECGPLVGGPVSLRHARKMGKSGL
jgi:hypothetical protein